MIEERSPPVSRHLSCNVIRFPQNESKIQKTPFFRMNFDLRHMLVALLDHLVVNPMRPIRHGTSVEFKRPSLLVIIIIIIRFLQ